MSKSKHLVSVNQALAIIAQQITPLGAETIPADAHALGRVLALPVHAVDDAPRFDCSAMDSYALRAAETANCPSILKVAPSVPAGCSPPPLAAGYCAPINTGARIPNGADAVVELESVAIDGDHVCVASPVTLGRNIRRQGEDIARGAQILGPGTQIAPDTLGAILNASVTTIVVKRSPRISLVSTGSELEEPGTPLDVAKRLDSNGPMLAAACAGLGLACDFLGSVADDRSSLVGVIDMIIANDSDIVISTGGVSTGSHDLVRETLESRGARVWFHGIAMRPGKPVLFATLADGRPWFGLPGNAIAAFVGFRFYVLAAVRGLLGLAPERGRPINVDMVGRPGVTLFLRGRRCGRMVDLDLDQRSHVFSSLLQADCWVRVELNDRAERESLLFEKMPTRLGEGF